MDAGICTDAEMTECVSIMFVDEQHFVASSV